jgi:hypothetical protein
MPSEWIWMRKVNVNSGSSRITVPICGTVLRPSSWRLIRHTPWPRSLYVPRPPLDPAAQSHGQGKTGPDDPCHPGQMRKRGCEGYSAVVSFSREDQEEQELLSILQLSVKDPIVECSKQKSDASQVGVGVSEL